MQRCEEVIWRPTEAMKRGSYAAKLEEKLGATDPADLWRKSVADIGHFWDVVVKDIGIDWFTPYTKTYDASEGIAATKWFLGGKLNVAHNCVDRHRDVTRNALLWEGDDGEVRHITYAEMADLVGRAASALRSLGVGRGDTVGILMPMLPETVIAMFACFKVGAIAVPIFSGFGADAVAGRLKDAKAKVLFTCDVAFRRGKPVDVKRTADEATADMPNLVRIVFRRQATPCPWDAARDRAWNEFVLPQSPLPTSEPMNSEDPCLLLYTSGTTGKPKGAVHTHAGSLATIGKELRYAFNVDEQSRFFWFTDIGWMMGPWEMIGVTMHGGTLFLFEGAPDFPKPSRLWETLARHRITHLGISPTVIRLLKKFGEDALKKLDLDQLTVLGSTGEPWDPESYSWFFENVGRRRCPIVNISGGTEIIGCLLSPLPTHALKPCSLGAPALGVDADVFDEDGKSVRGGIGHLVCKQPLPSMTKGFWNDRKRYEETYFARFPGVWYHGDWAHVDEEGHWFLHGRSDDTIKVAGKRIGPMEYEAALLQDPAVAEVAAVGVPDELKGEVCIAYVVLKTGAVVSTQLAKQLADRVNDSLGKAFAMREIRFATAVPKTRSGKIVRGLVRKVYLGETELDVSSVENVDAVEAIRQAKNA